MGLDYRRIGQRIATRRKALGLRQAQVCERCEINNNYLSNIERAKSIPSLEVFMRICEALDITPDELLAGTYRRDGQEEWEDVAQMLRGLDTKQLVLVSHFIDWVTEQQL